MGTISRNFNYKEFERSDTAKRYGISNVIDSDEVREAIKELTMTVLQPLRDSTGAPMYIRLGYRCPELNALIPGSSSRSQHQKGEAADIKDLFRSSLWLARKIVFLDLPYDQLILYPTFVHVSHKKGGPQRGQILYSSSYHGAKI